MEIPGRKLTRGRKVLYGLVTVIVIYLVVAVAMRLATSEPGQQPSEGGERGFLDPNTLAANVKEQGDRILKQHPKQTGASPGAHVKDVACVLSEHAQRTFECRLSYSSGDNETLIVLVSTDGRRWVPERVVP
jgi:hypothetical protein